MLVNADSIFDAKRIVSVCNSSHFKDGRKLDIHCNSLNKLTIIFSPENSISTSDLKVLLRIQPSPLPEENKLSVHKYVNTAENSKFGFLLEDLDEMLEILGTAKGITIHGIHCHLGSCIKDPKVYGHIAGSVNTLANHLLEEYQLSVQLLDIGGGIGINYEYSSLPGMNIPSTKKGDYAFGTDVTPFLQAVAANVDPKYKIILEPGRSLVKIFAFAL